MENKENKNLQGRRKFFKEAARKALPILGAAALISNPLLANAIEKESLKENASLTTLTQCQGCTGLCTSCEGCTGNCGGCTSCTGCTGGCFGCTDCTGCTGGCGGCTSCTGCTGTCKFLVK